MIGIPSLASTSIEQGRIAACHAPGMAKIMENDKAAAALPLTGPGRVAIPTVNAPDLQKEAAKRKV